MTFSPSAFDGFSVPIFIICRDMLSPLKELLGWLESAGYERIVLVDNDSTYPPLVEFLEQTDHELVRHRANLGPYDAIWSAGLIDRLADGEYYAVTDSDVVPDSGCPADALDFFHCVLHRYPGYHKAGFSLRIDDLPDCYALKAEAIAWERRFWWRPLERGLYHAPIDTTFALYRPNSAFAPAPAVRTGKPYWARHFPWYDDSKGLSEEREFYRTHVRAGITHWGSDGQHGSPPPLRLSARERLMWPLHSAFKVRRDTSVKCRRAQLE